MVTPNYNCKQAELYACAYIGWQSYGKNLAAFTAFKGFYTGAFGTAKVAAIDAAKALPDEQTRDEVAETLRIKLIEKGTDCTDAWQQVKRYIATAYPPELQKPKLEAAGSDYYREAAREDWEDLSLLMNAGSNFIAANTADLTAGNNMPVGFPVTFDGLKTSFDGLYLNFMNAEQVAFTQTEAKLLANNAVFDALMAMFLDGQQIFKKQSALMKQFIFENVLELVSSPGSSGLKGTVLNAIDSSAIADAEVTLAELSKTVPSDAAGKYDFGNFAAGTYTLKASKTGFVDFAEPVTIDTGVTSTKDIKLVPGP